MDHLHESRFRQQSAQAPELRFGHAIDELDGGRPEGFCCAAIASASSSAVSRKVSVGCGTAAAMRAIWLIDRARPAWHCGRDQGRCARLNGELRLVEVRDAQTFTNTSALTSSC